MRTAISGGCRNALSKSHIRSDLKMHKHVSESQHFDSDLDRLVFHEVDQSRWHDFEKLFGSRGGPKACWCMVWRTTPEEASHTVGASRKAAMDRRIAEGVPVGLLGYLDEEPAFEVAGFCEVSRVGTRRHIFQLKVANDK